MTNPCAMSTWVFSSAILLSSFLLDLGRKHFSRPEKKTFEPHQFSLLSSLQLNTQKNHSLHFSLPPFSITLKSPQPNKP